MLPKLRKLVLNGCSRLKYLPTAVDRLEYLTELALQGCTSLTSLPESIGNLIDLEVLDLTNCSSLQSLPDTMDALMGLKRLLLAGCTALQEYPPAVGRGVELHDGSMLPVSFKCMVCRVPEESQPPLTALPCLLPLLCCPCLAAGKLLHVCWASRAVSRVNGKLSGAAAASACAHQAGFLSGRGAA
jgi:hypothetical protein